jgi:hypothetical protein
MFIPRTLAAGEGAFNRSAIIRAVTVTLVLAISLFGVLAVELGTGAVDLAVGDIATEEIRAPRSLTMFSESETQSKKQDASDAVEPIYLSIAPAADIADRQLGVYDQVAEDVTTALTARDAGTLTGEALITALDAAAPPLSADQITLLSTAALARWEAMAIEGRRLLATAQATEIRDDAVADARQTLREEVTADLLPQERELTGDLAAAYVSPNLAYSAAETDAAREAAINGVESVFVTVREGETIVRAGDAVTPLALEKMTELDLTRDQTDIPATVAYATVAILLAILTVVSLARFRPTLWHRNRSLVLFVLALVVSAVALRMAGDRQLWAYVIPTSATVMLIGLLLGGYAGAIMAALLAIVAGLVNSNSLSLAVYVYAGGLAALVTILRAERMSVFFRAGIVLAVTNVAVAVSFALLEQRDPAALAQLAGAGVINAGLSILLAVGSFAVLGNVFGILTVFQLLELANPSNRLLRRLLLETPGTYHHAVMVGNLAERAAETIGADPLLARVAAYYHDIGKMKNPLAFIENQAGGVNIHDQLSPETSARIISAHVKDGIDLAYEHHLPVQVIAFIPQHHGTSLMAYFHGKALREAGPDTAVDDEVFRYPGPKPQTREAAILMLSDGVEASVRSLETKDEPEIRLMVDRIVDARLADGQLSECDLTLRDIGLIKEAFVQQLLGMYHQRIRYPDNVVPLTERRDSA